MMAPSNTDALHDVLHVVVEVHDDHAVQQDADEEGADDDAHDAAASTEEADAAEDDDEDDVEDHRGREDLRVHARHLGAEDHSGEERDQGRQRVHQHRERADGDTGHAGGVVVVAHGIEKATTLRAREEEMCADGDGGEDEDGDGHPQQRLLAHREEVVVPWLQVHERSFEKLGARQSINEHARGESGEERRQLHEGHQHSVGQTDGQGDTERAEHRRGGGHPLSETLHDPGGEHGDDGDLRQVDAAADDDDGHPHGENAQYRDAAHEREEIPGTGKSAQPDGESDEQDHRHGEHDHLLRHMTARQPARSCGDLLGGDS